MIETKQNNNLKDIFIKNHIKFLCSFFSFFKPIVYLGVWLVFSKWSGILDILKKENLDSKFYLYYLAFSFTVLLFGLITKSTLWSIGNKIFKIRGDSRARVLNYHGGEYEWFDLFADDKDFLKDNEKLIRSIIMKYNEKK